MNAVDGSEHYEKGSDEPAPSLLTIILDTNPAAWSLLADNLSLSDAVSDLLIFINAHLAFNYANKVAVIASHCSTAQWLYPTPSVQADPQGNRRPKRKASQSANGSAPDNDDSKRPKIDDSSVPTKLKIRLKRSKLSTTETNANKYRPFRLVEEELLRNLTNLLASTKPSEIATTTSTMIAGALTLALSHINREIIAHAEGNGGGGNRANATDPTSNQSNPGNSSSSNSTLQSRIMLLSVSPSTDLAHQYIPIMNSIFACQRLSIPIDICQLPLPSTTSATTRTQTSPSSHPTTNSTTSTVFLQQASDATHGIYIPIPPSPSPNYAYPLLQYLLLAFLPSNTTRRSLILPTRIDVDFRAACFCHRRVVDIGFVCSICLSIFCSVPEGGECLTCGTTLTLGEYGARPLVVARRQKKKKKRLGIDSSGSGRGTPTPGPS